nr:GspE/PulE family protein [Cellulomonas hominis]
MSEHQAQQARNLPGGDVLERAAAVTGHPAGPLFVELVRGTTTLEASSDLIAERTDPAAVALLSRERAETWGVIPLRFEGSTLVIAATLDTATNPVRVQDVTQHFTGQAIAWLVARVPEVRAKIAAAYRNDGEISELAATAAGDGSRTEALDARARMVELHIAQAIDDRASDIHFEPGMFEMAVRYRIDGVLVEKKPVPAEVATGVVAYIKTRAEIDLDRRIPHDGQMTFRHGARNVDIRVSTLPTLHGETTVLRILDNSTRLDLASFGMNDQVANRWREGFSRPHGMVLVTGPTGTGKSTTLYATLAELATRDRNIVTVENPVEYQMHGINQVQIHPEVGLTFANALRAILRQDPDVILLGEIRDKETATVAIEAALTGHLVLSTLHTNSAPDAAVRLVEMGVEPFLVASVLECALAQRLVRRLCEACRQRIEPTAADLEAAGFEVPAGTPTTFYAAHPDGCARCSRGYQGRVAVFEAVQMTAALEQFVVSGAVSSTGAKAAAEADGLTTMRQDGWLKVAQGLTTVAEILRVTA